MYILLMSTVYFAQFLRCFRRHVDLPACESSGSERYFMESSGSLFRVERLRCVLVDERVMYTLKRLSKLPASTCCQGGVFVSVYVHIVAVLEPRGRYHRREDCVRRVNI